MPRRGLRTQPEHTDFEQEQTELTEAKRLCYTARS
jgi:hypothetical protein